MDFFAIGNDELEKAQEEESFFFCEKCDEKHPIEQATSKCSYCSRCKEKKECTDNPVTMGFYKCHGSSYLYSINGKQVRRLSEEE